MRQGMTLQLHGVTLPLLLSNDFITPDFKEVVEFYPEYRQRAGRLAVAFQPYLLWVCDALAKAECRPGRTSQQWLSRIIEHFGLPQFTAWTKRFSSEVAA